MKRTPCSQRFSVGLWGVARPGNHRPLPGEGAPSGSARHFQISATGKHRENPQPAPSKADALGGPGGLAFPGSLSWSFKTVPAPTGRLAGGRVSHLVAEAPGETCITKRSFSNLLSRLRDLLTRGTWPHIERDLASPRSSCTSGLSVPLEDRPPWSVTAFGDFGGPLTLQRELGRKAEATFSFNSPREAQGKHYQD